MLLKKHFFSNCVNYPDAKELDYILEHGKQISYDEFVKHIGEDNIPKRTTSLKEDIAVFFYVSKLPNGKEVVYFQHSAIEYFYA